MATYTLTIKDGATEKVLAMLNEFSDVVEVNPLQTTKAEKTKTANNTAERVENPFNFGLARMKERVEDAEFVRVPQNLKNLEEFDKWLASDA